MSAAAAETVDGGSGGGGDRISKLPPEVRQHILQFLPLKDAVQTSALSTQWAHEWCHLPQLTLDSYFIESYSNIISDILLLHVGPIRKLVLNIPRSINECFHISPWLQFASRNGLKQLTLHGHSELNIPCYFLSSVFVGLTHLKLVDFSLFPFSNSKGSLNFPCLVSFQFHMWFPKDFEKLFGMNLANELEVFISKSPRLEIIELCFVCFSCSLAIRAPELRDLVFSNEIVPSTISLEGATTRLKTLALSNVWPTTKSCRDMISFFNCLSNVETLVLSGFFWGTCDKYKEGRPTKLGNNLEHLTSLELDGVPLNCEWAIWIVRCLFLSSPLLSKLHVIIKASCPRIFGCRTSNSNSIEMMEEDTDCKLGCLKNIQVGRLSFKSIEFRFIKFLLACSPVLEVMNVDLNEELKGIEDVIAQELIQYHKASTNVEIMVRTFDSNRELFRFFH